MIITVPKDAKVELEFSDEISGNTVIVKNDEENEVPNFESVWSEADIEEDDKFEVTYNDELYEVESVSKDRNRNISMKNEEKSERKKHSYCGDSMPIPKDLRKKIENKYNYFLKDSQTKVVATRLLADDLDVSISTMQRILSGKEYNFKDYIIDRISKNVKTW